MQKIYVETLNGKDLEIELGTDPFYFLKTTVRQLKEKLALFSELNKIIDDLRFKYDDQILQDDKWLFCYGIENGSRLTYEKWYNIRTVMGNYLKYGVKFIRAVDSITNVDDGELRAVLSCGHAVDPNSLTNWCKSLLDDGKNEFYCPVVTDSSHNVCNKKWDYEEVKRIALLNEMETEYFEKKLSENSAKTYFDFKQCPNCRSFIERHNGQKLKVKCVLCRKLYNKKFQFCWQCEREWLNPNTNSTTSCGRDNCFKSKKPIPTTTTNNNNTIHGTMHNTNHNSYMSETSISSKYD